MAIVDLTDFELLADFLMDIDSLKLAHRRSYLAGGSRLENTAEHSWHVAVAAWTLAKHSKVPIAMEKVLKLAVVHDLCELDHGDTFIHTANSEAQKNLERRCVSRLTDKYGQLFDELEDLWKEYERGRTVEAKCVRAVDRLLPFLHNIANKGKTWRQHGITRSQVLGLYRPMEKDFPMLVAWVRARVSDAVVAGWLRDE